jgi:hypothetical protein
VVVRAAGDGHEQVPRVPDRDDQQQHDDDRQEVESVHRTSGSEEAGAGQQAGRQAR